MKKCTKCKREKELTEFYKDKTTKNGYSPWCKECDKIRLKKYRAKNRQRNLSSGVTLKVKSCQGCRKEKSIENFNRNLNQKDGFSSWCKDCQKIAYRKNPNITRNYTLKHTYGITIKQYEKMLKQQEKCCAICGSKDAGRRDIKNLSVDHDHNTGKIRGLLCSKCNQALGLFKDNPETLRQAAQYLESHNLESHTQYSMTHPSVGFEEVC